MISIWTWPPENEYPHKERDEKPVTELNGTIGYGGWNGTGGFDVR